MSRGKDVLAAQALGCDFAYLGTRFIPTKESSAQAAYQQMIVDADSTDIIYSPFFTGVPGNYLKPSIVAAGIDPEVVREAKTGGSNGGAVNMNKDTRPKTWKDIWGAGQGVGSIQKIQSIREVIDEMIEEYQATRKRLLA